MKKTTITCDHCGKTVLYPARLELVFYKRNLDSRCEAIDATYDFCSNECAARALDQWTLDEGATDADA